LRCLLTALSAGCLPALRRTARLYAEQLKLARGQTLLVGALVLAATLAVVGIAATVSAQLGSVGDGGGAQHQGRPPTPGGYFPLLPVRASLPSGASCAARVRRSRWEPRPANYAANHRTPTERLSLAPHIDFDSTWNARYRTRITGRFVGTTDELIQWAACKWGLSDELLRAQAALESTWRQAAAGDLEDRSSGKCAPEDSRDPCPTSFGLLQNKWFFHKPGYPMLRTMTPFHLEWSAAQLRGCYDGRKRGFPGGDMKGCLSNWFSGGWRDPQGLDYADRVYAHRDAKPWLSWASRAAEVPYQTALRRPPTR
jgi:hypothetical protein